MKTRIGLAAVLLAVMSLPGVALAQGEKPAVSASSKDEERLKGVLGSYKADQPGFPGIKLTLKDGQLMMEAEGFPALPVTLTEKDELKAALLPPTFKFFIVRDKDGKAVGLKVDTPMGGAELKREAPKDEPKKPEEKKADALPDMLGVYEPDDDSLGLPKAEVVFEKGKLVIKTEGQPDRTITSFKDDVLTLDPAIEGVEKIKLLRDKDGKVVGTEVSASQGTLQFTRKTFVKLPGAEEKVEVPDVLGMYEADSLDSPIQSGEILLEKGQLVLRGEGQPDFPIKIDKDGNVTSPNFPEGVTTKLRKDKDGKVVGLDADTPLGKLGFTRKTFVKAPGAQEKKPDTGDAKLARLKAAAGTYKSDILGVPVVTMKVKDGKLMMEAEGFPALEVTLTDKDELKSELLPPGFDLKLKRDKDGKVTGMVAATPRGDAEFTFTPEK